jgi:uncharacterized protein
MKRRIVLAGGSGFIGQSLHYFLVARDFEVIILTRGPSDVRNGMRHLHWDGKTPGDWVAELDGAFALINLAGKSINCRHTTKNRRAIIDSRVDSVRALAAAIAPCAQPPRVFLQISAVGIYGDTGDRISDENAPHGSDLVAHVCERWESAFESVEAPGMRKVILRLGVVLGRSGGFLQVLSRLTRWFLGGHVGSGRQYVSWIHMEDLCRIVLLAIEKEVAGVFNATAPAPATNADLMRELRCALHRPWSPPVPAFVARLGAWLIGTNGSLALVSQRCVPKRLEAFDFDFPTLRGALANLYPEAKTSGRGR